MFQQAFKNSEQELRSTSWEPQAGGLTGMWESLSIPNWMNFWGILLLMFLYTEAMFDREIVST